MNNCGAQAYMNGAILYGGVRADARPDARPVDQQDINTMNVIVLNNVIAEFKRSFNTNVERIKIGNTVRQAVEDEAQHYCYIPNGAQPLLR